MIWDNIFTVSLTILEVDITLSLCFWSVALCVDVNYGDGFYKELGFGTRRAMKPHMPDR